MVGDVPVPGIFYVLVGRFGIGCIDLDHCFQDGELMPWAAEVLDEYPDALLIEVSGNGEGLHIFTEMPDGPGRKIRDGRNIEIYPPSDGSRDGGRYICVTGHKYWRN